MTSPIRIGTRGSELATTQAGHVRDAFIAAGMPAELVIITTAGDRSQLPVADIGVGVFTQALREAMAAGECDVAVHSFKDLPTAPDDRFVIAATPPRKDCAEVLIAADGMHLDALPEGAVVGTSAPRRIAQLRLRRSDLDIRPLRGNIDTRIGRVHGVGDLDAIILAKAGLDRTGRGHLIAETLDPSEFLPAPAQGALAVEVRADREDILTVAAGLSCPHTYRAVVAERTVLADLEAGCTAPIGVHSTWAGQELTLTGGVFAVDGSRALRRTRTAVVPDAAAARELGAQVAAELLAAGAAELMAVEGPTGP